MNTLFTIWILNMTVKTFIMLQKNSTTILIGTTVINIDNNNKYLSTRFRINEIIKEKKLCKCYYFTILVCYCDFNQINAASVGIKMYFFEKVFQEMFQPNTMCGFTVIFTHRFSNVQFLLYILAIYPPKMCRIHRFLMSICLITI